MKTRDILNNLLQPINPKYKKEYQFFLDTVDENISWYPSAGLDFRDIIFLNNAAFNQTNIIPSVHIHTDRIFANDMIFNQQVQESDGINVTINNVIELRTNINLNCNDDNVGEGIKHLKGRELSGAEQKTYLQMKEFEKNSSRIYLLNVSIEYNDILYEKKNILYFFIDNNCFFERFVLDQNFQISLIFCHCSQSFDVGVLNELLNGYHWVEYLISDAGTFSSLEEFQNEVIEVNANLSLHCINTLSILPFDHIMKTFQINRH